MMRDFVAMFLNGNAYTEYAITVTDTFNKNICKLKPEKGKNIYNSKSWLRINAQPEPLVLETFEI